MNNQTESKPEYIAYPSAYLLLKERLNATPEEIAAWIYLGTENDLGGLNAYLNAEELDSPTKFRYNIGNGENFDYVSPLIYCWFIPEEIKNFQPIQRYISGKALIAQWSNVPGINAKDYIIAKVSQGSLHDIHPIWGLTSASEGKLDGFPHMEDGLYEMTKIERIETNEFGWNINRQVTFSEPQAFANFKDSNWKVKARKIADEIFDQDTKLNCRRTLKAYADLVMDKMQELEIHGPRGRFDNSGTIMREALQGNHWWKNKAK